MKEDDISWDDIDRARNMLLSKSDWTQLLDAGLTTECVMTWREWRKKVREVTKSKYSERLDAKKALRDLNDNKPPEHKGNLDISYLAGQSSTLITRDHIRDIVEEVLNEHGYEILERDDTVEKVTGKVEKQVSAVDKMTAIKNELLNVLTEKMNEISPNPVLAIFHMELLNESVDCLSGQGDHFPLLQWDEHVDPTIEAEYNVKDHGALIRKYAKMYKAYRNYRGLVGTGTMEFMEELPDRLRKELDEL